MSKIARIIEIGQHNVPINTRYLLQSSLLMALLGELPLVSGSMKTNGRIAYASQLPWVFSASVRQNIVFGGEFDMTRYQRAIKTAALSKVMCK